MSENQQRKQVAMAALLLALSTLFVYLPVQTLDFTNFDDPDYVTENPPVRGGVSKAGLLWAFTHFHSGNWHPVTWISHMLDCQFYGLNPTGHHVTNALFHLANVIILFLVLKSLTGAIWRSGFVAGLFALHPLHVESVAWISERKDGLSAFFGLLTIWAYARYVQSLRGAVTNPEIRLRGSESTNIAQRRFTFHVSRFYFLGLLFFALSLMSKPMLVTLPVLFFLLDFWPLRRLRNINSGKGTSRPWLALVLEKIPFIALSAASCVVTLLAQQSGRALAPLDQVPLVARGLNAVVSYARYLGKMLWPTDLSVIYPAVSHWPISMIIPAVLLMIAGTGIAIWLRKSRPYLFFGWIWFLVTLVPVIGLVQVGNQSIADRYTYLPSVGPFIILSWGLAEVLKWLFSHSRQRVGDPIEPGIRAGSTAARTAWAGVVILSLAACGILARFQVQVWRNTQTLFNHALAVTKNNFVAYNSLGFYYVEHGQPELAGHCFESALAINRANPFCWSGLARVSFDQGRYDDAIKQCRSALERDPRLADAHATLARALLKQGQTDPAIAEYEATLELRPDSAPAHYNLGNVLAARGQIAEARRHYQEAVRLDPRSADGHNNLAYMLSREGKPTEAIPEFRAAMALEPSLWQGHFGLAEALYLTGQTREAIAEYREVLRLRPDFPDALNRLAWILAVSDQAQIRDGAESTRLAEQACGLTHYQQPAYVMTLAAAYAEVGRFEDAMRVAEQARGLAQASGQADMVRRSEHLIEQFRSSRPYREPPKASP